MKQNWPVRNRAMQVLALVCKAPLTEIVAACPHTQSSLHASSGHICPLLTKMELRTLARACLPLIGYYPLSPSPPSHQARKPGDC